MKIGDKVGVYCSSYFYDADGEIIGETNNFFRVKITNHKTFGELWGDQKEEIKLFHKKHLMERGFSKGIDTGSFCEIGVKK